MLRRSVRGLVPRANLCRFASTNGAGEDKAMREIYFESMDGEKASDKPFRIVGIRDVEVSDWDYPNREDLPRKDLKNRSLRNRFEEPNFISLWVDRLPQVREFLVAQNTSVPIGEIEQGPDGNDLFVVPPSEKSMEVFNLCDAPAFVEIVQAPEDVIKEFDEDFTEDVKE